MPRSGALEDHSLLPFFLKKKLKQRELRGAGKRSPLPREWTGRDSNPRPPRCQRGDRTRLIYQPSDTVSTNKNHLSIMHPQGEIGQGTSLKSVGSVLGSCYDNSLLRSLLCCCPFLWKVLYIQGWIIQP